jgi:hypothetical protein
MALFDLVGALAAFGTAGGRDVDAVSVRVVFGKGVDSFWEEGERDPFIVLVVDGELDTHGVQRVV